MNERSPLDLLDTDDDLTDEYLEAMQRWLDEQKGPDFKLTPLHPPGW